jgi:hypothetical protein
MVTFLCQNCDATLKKKQLKTHQYSCRTNAFLCIDCKKVFVGNEHEGHTSCLSEQEMTWGQYYKGNKNKQGNNNANTNGANGNKTNGNTAHPAEESKVNPTKIVQETVVEEEAHDEPITFKGWQKTIKALLKKEKDHSMKKSALKKKLKQLLIDESYELVEDEFDESIDKVLSFNAFEVTDGYIKYLPSGQREAKKQTNVTKFKDFSWEKKITTQLNSDPNKKLKAKRLKKSLVEEFLSKYPGETEETAEKLFEEATTKIPHLVQDGKFIQIEDDE